MTKQPARFDQFRRQAEVLLKSPARVQRLTGQAVRKLTQRGGEGIAEAKDQLQTAIALLNAWRTGEYTGVSNKTLVIIAAALLYFVVPMDVIPDFLFAWGLVDDIAVVGYVFSQVTEEIDAFKAWQENSKEQAGEQEEEQEEEQASGEPEAAQETDATADSDEPERP